MVGFGEGLGNCNKCGDKLQMYYRPWCPKCDKPQLNSHLVLNLIQALDHIGVVTNDEGYKRRMWSVLIDLEIIRTNDSYEKWWLNETDEEWDDYTFTKQNVKDINLFNETFDLIGKQVLLEISW